MRAVALVALALSGASLLAQPAAAADPTGVTTRLEGCRNDGSITLPNGSGDFICADAAYTPGNLGKGWNELDLVPFRLTVDAGNSAPSTQTYTVAVVLDSMDGSFPGYDVLSAPQLNTALSAASCTAPVVGAETVTSGFGGVDESRYRTVTITQLQNTVCVYDYYGRLALGSHLNPGSDLHASLADENLGGAAKKVSIPVKEIAPQELAKDMSATQDSDHAWDITKSATPASIGFDNTCDPEGSRQSAVSITVTWTKLAATASGPITVITHVYATNPAARTVTVNVSDVIRSGTTALDVSLSGAIDVPANTASFLVLTHTTTVPSGTTDLNDVATGSYTDKVTGVPIPGTTTATASAPVQASGVTLNQSAVINDLESISGAGFQYSTDGFAGATGAFDGGYLAGTPTTGDVSWTSDSQSGSGSVTFSKTVYVATGTSSSGTLSDTAALTGSDGFTTDASLEIDLRASATVSLTITKHIPNVLQTGESQQFQFDVEDADGVVVASPTVTFGAGETDQSVTVDGLTPGAYTVSEEAASGWAPPGDPQGVDLSLPTCSGEVEFTNNFAPAAAQAVKVTDPAGGEAGWAMTLNGPGTPAGGETVGTDASGTAVFTTALGEGSYTISETAQAGWDQTGTSGDCSFTVNLPADAGRTFTCTIRNRARGHIIVEKVTEPTGATQKFTFTPSYGSTFQLGDAEGSDSGALVPGSYSVAETEPPGWDLYSATCSDGSAVTAISLQAGETVTCRFTNRQRGSARVIKTVRGAPPSGLQSFTFQLRSGASSSAAGTTLETGVANAANGGVLTFSTGLVPGTTYQLCEIVMPAWSTTLGTFVPDSFMPPDGVVPNPNVDNSILCINFTVQPGETRVFAVDNTPPPGGRALTIGFWKNWASCAASNGKQKPVLDQVLATFPVASGQTKPGIYIGDLYVDTCAEAVALLNKSDVKSGKKMASDPAFNLAAQLMATELNFQAGAGKCPAAVTAETQAQALLRKYHFDGTGSYTSGAKKMSAADQTLANQLARSLDDYNNNRLC